MNQANNLAQVDVLGWLASQVESHRALSMSDAYYAQELPRVEAVYSAVAELVAADLEVDATEAALKRAARCGGKERTRRLNRLIAAKERRAAALRPFNGSSA